MSSSDGLEKTPSIIHSHDDNRKRPTRKKERSERVRAFFVGARDDDDMCTRGRRATPPLFGKEDARPPRTTTRIIAAFADRDDDVDFGTTVTILQGGDHRNHSPVSSSSSSSSVQRHLSFNAREKKKKKKKKNEEEREGARTIEKKSGVVSPEDLLFLNVFPEKAMNEDEDTTNFLSLDGMFETLSDANDDVLREGNEEKEEEEEEEEMDSRKKGGGVDSLSRVPNDVLCEITAKYLSAKDVLSLEQTSNTFREIFSRNELCWKNQYLKKYRWRPEEQWALATTLPFSSGLQKKAIKPPNEGWKNALKRAVLRSNSKVVDDDDDDKRVVITCSPTKDKVENINEALKNLRDGDVCVLEAGTYYGSIRVPSGVHLRGVKLSREDLVHIVADDEPAIVGVENINFGNSNNTVMVSNVSLWRHRAARDGSIGCFGHHPKHTACVHSESKNIRLSLETCDIVSAGEGVVAHNCEVINSDVSSALSGIVLRNGDISGCVVTSAIAEDQKSKINIDSSSQSSSDEADDVEMLELVTDEDEEEDDAISIDSQSLSASRVYASIVILGSDCEDSAEIANVTRKNDTSVDVRNTRIVMNSSHGISCLNGAEATVRGCLIANNEGGGVCVGKNSRIRMFENLIALNTGVGFAVWGGGYGEALRCEIRENSHTGVDVSCLGVVKERNNDYYNIYGRGGNDEDGGNETDDEEYESELMSFLLAQRQHYAITHRIVLKECLIDNINVSGGAHCDAFDCIIRKNSNDEKQTCVSVEKDSFLRISPS